MDYKEKYIKYKKKYIDLKNAPSILVGGACTENPVKCNLEFKYYDDETGKCHKDPKCQGKWTSLTNLAFLAQKNMLIKTKHSFDCFHSPESIYFNVNSVLAYDTKVDVEDRRGRRIPAPDTILVGYNDGTNITEEYGNPRHISSGGFGAVIEYENKNNPNVKIAVKMGAIERDIKVINILKKSAKSYCDNFIVNSYNTTDGKYIVMDRMDGTVSDLLKKGIIGPRDQKAIMSLLVQVTKALFCLYYIGLYYLDLKPINLLYKCVDEHHFYVLLGDLGSAMTEDSTGVATYPPPHSMSGMIRRRDPDKDKNKRGYGKDIVWTIGVFLLELLGLDAYRSIYAYINPERASVNDIFTRGRIFEREHNKILTNVIREFPKFEDILRATLNIKEEERIALKDLPLFLFQQMKKIGTRPPTPTYIPKFTERTPSPVTRSVIPEPKRELPRSETTPGFEISPDTPKHYVLTIKSDGQSIPLRLSKSEIPKFIRRVTKSKVSKDTYQKIINFQLELKDTEINVSREDFEIIREKLGLVHST